MVIIGIIFPIGMILWDMYSCNLPDSIIRTIGAPVSCKSFIESFRDTKWWIIGIAILTTGTLLIDKHTK